MCLSLYLFLNVYPILIIILLNNKIMNKVISILKLRKLKTFGSFAFFIRSFVFFLAKISMPSKTLFCKFSMANITLGVFWCWLITSWRRIISCCLNFISLSNFRVWIWQNSLILCFAIRSYFGLYLVQLLVRFLCLKSPLQNRSLLPNFHHNFHSRLSLTRNQSLHFRHYQFRWTAVPRHLLGSSGIRLRVNIPIYFSK